MAISKSEAVKATKQSASDLVDIAEPKIDDLLMEYSTELGFVRVGKQVINFEAAGVLKEIQHRYGGDESSGGRGWNIRLRTLGQMDVPYEDGETTWLEFS